MSANQDLQLATAMRTLMVRLVKKLRKESVTGQQLSLTERSTMGLLYRDTALLPSELAAMEKWKSKTRIPTFPEPQTACGARWNNLIQKPRKESSSRLSPHLGFKIILYWNQSAISVSFFDWKMLS